MPIQQVVLNAINNIEKASKLKGTVTGIPTGFMDLDYKTSGMHASDLVLIAARPSMGKTAFVLNIAQYMAFRKDVTVAILQSGNDQRSSLSTVWLPWNPSGFPRIRIGKLKDDDWKAYRRAGYYSVKSTLILMIHRAFPSMSCVANAENKTGA